MFGPERSLVANSTMSDENIHPIGYLPTVTFRQVIPSAHDSPRYVVIGFIRSLLRSDVNLDMDEVEQFVDELIKSKKVVVVSKSWCIYCKRVRKALAAYPLQDVMEWIDINKRPDGRKILNYTRQITGSRTLPRIFIGGEFFGGCNELYASKKNGVLEKKLTEIGAI
uniref:Glutaredoxin domain-containing protein n=1 Tax=Setaria digitata TaxID=48799 RepID=A0A915PP93_9BILA